MLNTGASGTGPGGVGGGVVDHSRNNKHSARSSMKNSFMSNMDLSTLPLPS